jgi:hypothetical protein
VHEMLPYSPSLQPSPIEGEIAEYKSEAMDGTYTIYGGNHRKGRVFLVPPLLGLALQHKYVIQRTYTIKLRGNSFMKVQPVLFQPSPPIHQHRIL